MNDPNGLVTYKGEYHLFFQHNPHSKKHGDMTWGHAVSTDLLHWQELRPAIFPDSMGDAWSGSAVVDWHNKSGLQEAADPPLLAIYTNFPRDPTKAFVQRLAVSKDAGRTFRQLQNPVVPGNPSAMEARDPKVFWHAPSQQWIMVLWLHDDVFRFHASKNLLSWTVLQDLRFRDGYECPDFVELPVAGRPGEKWHVLLSAGGRYLIGHFDGKWFTPKGQSLLAEYGDAYAGQTYNQESFQRTIQVAWLGRFCSEKFHDQPFTNQMTVPMEMDLVSRPEGLRLRRRPAGELKRLRKLPAALVLRDARVRPRERRDFALPGCQSAVEVLLRVRTPLAGESALRLSLLGREIMLNVFGGPKTQHIVSGPGGQRSQHWHEVVSSRGLVQMNQSTLPVKASSDYSLELVILIDTHSVEVFDAQGGASMAVCTFPFVGRDSRQVYLEATTTQVELQMLEVYELEPALGSLPGSTPLTSAEGGQLVPSPRHGGLASA